MLNSIQFLTNLIAFSFCLVLKNTDLQSLMDDMLLMVIPLNGLTIVIFSYLFVLEYQSDKEDRDLLTSFETDTRDFNKMHARLVINEGRFILYYIWGANIALQ